MFSWRSPAMVLVIAKRQGIDAYCSALPITKNLSEAIPVVRPMYAKRRIWNSGPITSVGM